MNASARSISPASCSYRAVGRVVGHEALVPGVHLAQVGETALW